MTNAVDITIRNPTDSHLIDITLKARSLFAAAKEVQAFAGKCTEKEYRNFADCVYVNVSENGVFRAEVHHFRNVWFSKYSHTAGYGFSVLEYQPGGRTFNESDTGIADLITWCISNNIPVYDSGIAS
jgi:hypothetical protein